MRFIGKSDIGLVRKANEDNFLCLNICEELNLNKNISISLFIVADGMGGHNAGEIASSMAIDEIKAFIKNNFTKLGDYETNETEVHNLICDAIIYANDKIYKKAIMDSSCHGMGTTLSLVLIIDKTIYIGHVGDSRIYLIRNNQIIRLTEDHSLVAELVKSGTIKPEEAVRHPQKNVITRAIGTEYSVDTDSGHHNINDGDYIVLCTDGLSNLLEDEEIMNIVFDSVLLDDACDNLINTAKARGGHDNITVVLIQIEKGGEANDR